MTDLSVADVLYRAADLIEPEGKWTQGVSYRSETGSATHEDNACSMCLLGALWLAGDKVDGPATYFMKNFLGKWPAEWNDVKSRKQPQVVAKLRQAAALAREQGL